MWPYAPLVHDRLNINSQILRSGEPFTEMAKGYNYKSGDGSWTPHAHSVFLPNCSFLHNHINWEQDMARLPYQRDAPGTP